MVDSDLLNALGIRFGYMGIVIRFDDEDFCDFGTSDLACGLVSKAEKFMKATFECQVISNYQK